MYCLSVNQVFLAKNKGGFYLIHKFGTLFAVYKGIRREEKIFIKEAANVLAIVVGTHGSFAEELIKTCEMICGAVVNVKAVTLVPGEGAEDLAKKYEDALVALDTKDGVLFLNDLFGGSPYNAACRMAVKSEHYGIVTGVNLPMLIEMIGYQQTQTEIDILQAIQKAEEAGKDGIHPFHISTMVEEEEDL